MVTGNIEQDFFEQNPFLRVKKEYANLLKEEPKEASRIAWSIFLIEDISKNNPLRNMSKEDRIKEVSENYYAIDLDKYKHIVDAYLELCMSKEMQLYKIQLEKLEEVTMYVKKLNMDDDSDKIIKILEKLGKMWDSLEKSRVRMEAAEAKSNPMKNIKESYRERRSRQ